jgi:hypothetical protein
MTPTGPGEAPGEPYLACDLHGRLRHRDLEGVPDGAHSCVWSCEGFDGEWCHLSVRATPVPYAARLRLLAGETYWPGVVISIPELDSSQEHDLDWSYRITDRGQAPR